MGAAVVLRDASGNGTDVELARPVMRTRGVYGNALNLRDKHALQVNLPLRRFCYPSQGCRQ